ncbi:hypothetical protein B0H66DRAFT_364100 [Apodospora peruviana]|uniref:Nonsense-mediated mRNA decay factor n=1 Tax=Apodospora peruviana TaxID=516989 RepID=A0AAE0HXL7_9PEZI|nr:hypothetical protein B0H66DRAFT_364100 [Apodospora peruviana]
MATPTATATITTATEKEWERAKSQHVTIDKELKRIQEGGSAANELARFEKIEKLMQNFRLACINTMWPDIRAAAEKRVEDILWQTHANVTKVYRKAIARLQSSDRVVLKRKIEKLYLAYLRTAQYFYKAYLQRVCARYNVKALKRIARRAELEEMPVPDQDIVDAAAENLEETVTASAHKMLIYLGDLSRYRTLARPKDRRWHNALAYYSLANELIPESGLGYHQCGVIFSETEDHLEVVYHFYRALACDKPHPNASTNLEREFRDLQQGTAGASKGINDAMLSWFVKLHANYFKGEEFSGRKELEDEVDHRLEMALKKGTQSDLDMGLLKMILINILAFQVGLEKTRTEWSDTGSRSCQFILLQNVRTIHTISRILREELVEIVQREPVEPPDETRDSASPNQVADKFTPVFRRTLPLIRVYMTWLCFYNTDLVGYQDHLQPQFGIMCKTLANALNLLFDLVANEIASLQTPVPFRFPEDEETLGMRCLNGPELPEGCRLHYHPVLHTPKPRAEDIPDSTFTADDVALTRALGVLSCALNLANDSPFPIMHSKIMEDSQERVRFLYTEIGKPVPTTNMPANLPAAPVDAAAAVTMSAVMPAAVDQPPMPAVAVVPTENDSDAFSGDEDFYAAPVEKPTSSVRRVLPEHSTVASRAAPGASEFPIENQLYGILNDFLTPPETGKATRVSESRTDSQSQNQTSYGMGSTTAREVLGSVASTSPTPDSANGKTFPTLPWNYFYTPAIGEGLLQHAAKGNSPGWGTTNGLATSRPGTSRVTTQGQGVDNLTIRNMVPVQTRQHNASTVPRGHHAAASTSQQGLSRVGPDFTNRSQQASIQGHGIREVWTEPGEISAQPSTVASSKASQPDPWGSPAGHWQLGQYSMGDQPPAQSQFSPMAFSGANSSLPPVNSPWGLPAKAQLGAPAHRTQPSASWLAAGHSPSPLGDNASSTPLVPSYPGSISSPGLAHNNGKAYDAAAVYWHGSMPSPVEHNYATNMFGSGVHGTTKMEEYDRQALMSAWAGNYTSGPSLQTAATAASGAYHQAQSQAQCNAALLPTASAGSNDPLKPSAAQWQKQQPITMAGQILPQVKADGRSRFENVPKR